jgi:Cu(I)/Ag(I) efflux system membrane fusion protein
MPENPARRWQGPTADGLLSENSEGGLRAPPGLGFWGKAWWWFHFLILVKLARLRFIGLLLAIGFVIVKWDTLIAYYERWARPADTDHAAGSDVEYFCPMHPTVIRDNRKEKCPICFMPLSKRKKGEIKDVALPPGVVNRVQLSPYRVVLAGIQTWKVAYVPLFREITTVGSVEFNERELKQVAARVKGRLDKLYVNETGEMVHAGDELASLYSPELLVTVQNLLDAKQSGNASLQQVARDRLELWGISKDQIDQILKAGKANTHLKIRSPIDGHVIKKYVKEGQYVDEGSPLYDLADLSTVWIQGQVYEDDMAFLPAMTRPYKKAEAIKYGLPVTATTLASPTEKFEGKLTFVYPHTDQETRTVVVRFEVENPGHKLRPGTSATVKLKVPPRRLDLLVKAAAEDWAKETAAAMVAHALAAPGGPALLPGIAPLLGTAGRNALLQQGIVLAVPETAVIDTGSQKLVYREVLPGEYEGVKVELGPRMLGPKEVVFYPVLGGLQPGEMIVTAGSFLVDAETRLNPAAGSIYFGGSSGTKGGTSSVTSVRPSTPEDKDALVKAALAKLPEGDRRLAEAQKYCPVLTANRLGSMGIPAKVMLQGKPVFLCCKGCEKEARDNASRTLARVEEFTTKGKTKDGSAAQPPTFRDEDKEVKAALAKLNAEDRRLAEQQKFCPITDDRLGSGSMGVPVKVIIQGQPVFLCCEGCREEALANQARTLAKVKELKAKSRSSPK